MRLLFVRIVRVYLLSFVVLCLWASMMTAHAANLTGTASAYLSSHENDPIGWYPWRDETLVRAREEGKPVFLMIGYAACHWCHVMARTTLADARVISALNTNFTSILVDREERPDLDSHFMKVMSVMTGRTGYPATFLLTPDMMPLYSTGTIGADAEFGSPGLVDLLHALSADWATNSGEIRRNAVAFQDDFHEMTRWEPAGSPAHFEDPRPVAARVWGNSYDAAYGGFGGEPKFTHTNVLLFLLHHGVQQGDQALLEKVFTTLDYMAAGGIRDHLGGVFHRYAVDRYWQIPHFEVMLDQNALLARLYLEAFQVSGATKYAVVARGILDDLISRFRLPNGTFAAALDADSQGGEGTYYTWTSGEIESVLGPERAKPFIATYVDPRHGLVNERSVLRIQENPFSFLDHQNNFTESLSLLRDQRVERTPPKRDDQVLTSWNALAVSAFAKAAQIFDDERYLQMARKTLMALSATTPDDLFHSRLGRAVNRKVFLSDYAFLIQANIDLYETTFDVHYLACARVLMKALITRFQVNHGQPFQLTPTNDSTSIPPQVVLDEQEIPSGNATALMALLRLTLFSADQTFGGQAQEITQSLHVYLKRNAPHVSGLLDALSYRPDEAREIVIVGDMGDSGTRKLLNEVYERPLFNVALAVISPGSPRNNEDWLLLSGRPLLDAAPTAYVCKNRLCDLPVDTVVDFAKQLDQLVNLNVGDKEP